MIVSDYIAKFLVAKGVKHVFGFQGSAMLKMLDSIVSTGSIEYIQGFHEQASAFAADAYARVSGMPGVAMATAGPGASNLVTGIANAYYDSVPVVFLTGQDYLPHIRDVGAARQNGFQDMDIVPMVKGITKYAVRVDDCDALPGIIAHAWEIATSGRKGPVLIDIPIDVQFAEMSDDVLQLIGYNETSQDSLNSEIPCEIVDSIVKAFNESRSPVVLVGGGVRESSATAACRHFIEKTKFPVVSTLMGLDVIDGSLGFSGLYGNTVANLALLNADLILALGVRFSFKQIGRDKLKYAPKAKVIQVDIDKAERDRTFMKADIWVEMDLNSFFQQIEGVKLRCAEKDWLNRLRLWKEEYGDSTKFGDDRTDPVAFVEEVQKALSQQAVIVSDVGANQAWTAQGFVGNKNIRLINSANFGAMGYALPAAIGASYAAQNIVVAMTGDGGLQMNIQELNTLSIRRNNVKVIVFNNGVLGLMREVQLRYYGGRFHGNSECEFSCPDLKKLADVYNLRYVSVSQDNDVDQALIAIAQEGPCLIDFKVDPDAKVLNRYDDRALANG